LINEWPLTSKGGWASNYGGHLVVAISHKRENKVHVVHFCCVPILLTMLVVKQIINDSKQVFLAAVTFN